MRRFSKLFSCCYGTAFVALVAASPQQIAIDTATGSPTTTDTSAAVVTLESTRVLTLLTAVTDQELFLPTNVTYFSPSTTITVGTTAKTGSLVTTGTGTETVAPTAAPSTTSTSAKPTSTRACNNYPEFCSRQYSNITEICAHNSPFNIPGDLFSNQHIKVSGQLNDGIRMLQGQVHLKQGVLHFCHTKCEFIDAGPIVDYLTTVRQWLDAHPNDVVTVLMGNSDNVPAVNFSAPLRASGLLEYAYVPPKIPMGLNDWPTLGELIDSKKRVILFLDYNANQLAFPPLLDQFSQLWETTFSPTNRAFPCDVQRPPGLVKEQAQGRMYMANHNLNVEMKLDKLDILLPAVAEERAANADKGKTSLGEMRDTCTAQWGRPPNFLLVDYYDVGDGSVFRTAAKANNVTYNRKCCTKVFSKAGPRLAVSAVFTGMTGGLLFAFAVFVIGGVVELL